MQVHGNIILLFTEHNKTIPKPSIVGCLMVLELGKSDHPID